MNSNKRESAALEAAMRLVSPSSRTDTLSQWSAPSLVVLRALEMAGVSCYEDVLEAFYPLSHCQAAPVLSIRSHAFSTWADRSSIEKQVVTFFASGAVVDPGVASFGDSGHPRWVCLRFPVGGRDEKIVAGLARGAGSAAQCELDWRECESERGARRSEVLRPEELA